MDDNPAFSLVKLITRKCKHKRFLVFVNFSNVDIFLGRPWRMDELRIKSNSDLHKLWLVSFTQSTFVFRLCERNKEELHGPIHMIVGT